MKVTLIKPAALALVLSLFIMTGSKAQDVITVDMRSRGPEVPSSLYGVFFEEITHSGDGGLYAEMIQNRGFEDGRLPSGTYECDGFACAHHLHSYYNDSINKFRVNWDFEKRSMNGWKVTTARGGQVPHAVVTDNPLNEANYHNLRIDCGAADSPVLLVNGGYWGIAVEKGKKYDLEFYYRSADGGSVVTASLADGENNNVVTQDIKVLSDGQWNRYTATFTAPVTAGDLNFVLTFAPEGEVRVDHVSLFPRDTFKGRKNGLRKDIAQTIADLHPAFMRWPGGCIVEGLTMDNRVKWKETIGDPAARPGEYNLWGYRSTFGFGYHEFLHYCEDIGADGMFVCNAGMACLFRNGDYVSQEDLQELIDEALDAIEYAIGGTDTRWGAERARNGHPKPFPLKYVEIGNENVGPMYAANYNRFHRAIREKYPQIVLVTALQFSQDLNAIEETDIIDPHYYETADWFYNNADVYDKLPDDFPYKVYVGEYAAVGRSDIYSSLAEGAFMTGVERNSDKIQLVSYAPLLQNAAHGKNHLIVHNNQSVYGRTNYYVMKMLAENMPTYVLDTAVADDDRLVPVVTDGFIGLMTTNTSAQFKDVTVTSGGKTLYRSGDWNRFSMDWDIVRGEWNLKNGVLTQPAKRGMSMVRLDRNVGGDYTIELKALKLDGGEGFKIVFGGRDEQNCYMADIGSHGNESVIFRQIKDGVSVSLFDYRNQWPVVTHHWYDVKLEIKGNNWKCWLDGELAYEYNHYDVRKNYVASGYDAKKGEVVIKLVNGENTPWTATVDLAGAAKVAPTATRIEMAGADQHDENSFEEPTRVSPRTDKIRIDGGRFDYTASPNSFTVLRIKAK